MYGTWRATIQHNPSHPGSLLREHVLPALV